MTEPRRPSPQPHPAREVSRPKPDPRPAPPGPRPAPPRPRPAPQPTAAKPRSRAQRLHAERIARRLRLRRALEVVAAALAIVVVISLVLALTSGGGTRPRRGAASSTGVPAPTGASLRDPYAVSTFLGSAASDIAAISTYDYRHLDDALGAGLAVTTGQFRQQYQLSLTGDLARTATAEHVVHTFEVLDIGIGAMNPAGTAAKVLVFGRERITDDSTGPEGQVNPITLCATIQRVGSRYLVSNLVQDVDPGLPPAGPGLPEAVAAAKAEVANTLTYTRSDFPTDLQRALDGATSPLREQLQSTAAGTRTAMVDGHYDTTGTVTATAVVRSDADTATLMIAADEIRTVDGAAQPADVQHRYEVTVTQTETGWAVSRIVSVDGGD
jgi:hypothetical protein